MGLLRYVSRSPATKALMARGTQQDPLRPQTRSTAPHIRPCWTIDGAQSRGKKVRLTLCCSAVAGGIMRAELAVVRARVCGCGGLLEANVESFGVVVRCEGLPEACCFVGGVGVGCRRWCGVWLRCARMRLDVESCCGRWHGRSRAVVPALRFCPCITLQVPHDVADRVDVRWPYALAPALMLGRQPATVCPRPFRMQAGLHQHVQWHDAKNGTRNALFASAVRTRETIAA